MSPSATDYSALDECPARVTRLPLPAENLDVQVLSPRVALPVDIVLEAGAPVLDPPFEHRPAGAEQAVARRGMDLTGRCVGPHSGLEQRLVDVDVPESGNSPLVEQGSLDRRAPAGQSGSELRQCEARVDWLRAEPGERLRAVVDQPPGAKLPQIAPAEIVAFVEYDARPLVRLGTGSGIAPHQPPGHTKVNDKRAVVVQPEEQVLPAPVKCQDRSPNQQLAQSFERGASQEADRARVHLDCGNAPPAHQWLQVAPYRLDFGQFGHSLSVAGAGTFGKPRGPFRCGPGRAILPLMITHLQGRLARMDIGIPAVEIDVGGIRYEVLVPLFLWPDLHALAGEADLNDDSQWPSLGLHIFYSASANQPVPVLAGFLRRPDRAFCRKLTAVVGIGPARAVKAMNVSVSTIARAIEREDRATLTRLPGIGTRGADKIIASLRGKVVAEASLQDGGIASPVDAARLELNRVSEDAVEAIVALGYPRNQAKQWVQEALASEPGLSSIEDLTIAVLRRRDAR